MLKLYFLRHGQTDYNLNGIIQGGGIDSNLNATGEAQGAEFHAKYRGIRFDAVVHSGLKRTRQTIARFLDTEAPVLRMPEFDEMNWGVLEGLKATAEMHAEFIRLTDSWRAGHLDDRIEGGESPRECWERARQGLAQIQAEVPRGKVLVCTHGRMLRVLLSAMLGYGLQNMEMFPHANTALNLVNILPAGKVYAELLNDLSHLN